VLLDNSHKWHGWGQPVFKALHPQSRQQALAAAQRGLPPAVSGSCVQTSRSS
jgi:hypothetical protein